MEMVREYIFLLFTRKKPLPFPEYLQPINRHKNDFWITQEGECIYPSQMENRHLLNTVRLMHRTNAELEYKYDSCHGDSKILYGLAPQDPSVRRINKKNSKIMQPWYNDLWKNKRIYMLLRREVKLRGLEEYL